MPELDRGGWTLRYELAGDGPELVVLTHGFGATAETWRHQVPALVDAGYRVLTWDLRAHGRSGSPDEADHVAHARGGSRRGRAGGGWTGARARPLRRRGDHDAVRARPSGARAEPRAGRHGERVQRARARLVRVARGDRRERKAARRSSRSSAHATWPTRRRSRTGSRASRVRWAGFTRRRSRASSKRVRCPTFVVVGEKDFLGVGGSVIISRRIAGSRLEIVHGARARALPRGPRRASTRCCSGSCDRSADSAGEVERRRRRRRRPRSSCGRSRRRRCR